MTRIQASHSGESLRQPLPQPVRRSWVHRFADSSCSINRGAENRRTVVRFPSDRWPGADRGPTPGTNGCLPSAIWEKSISPKEATRVCDCAGVYNFPVVSLTQIFDYRGLRGARALPRHCRCAASIRRILRGIHTARVPCR